MDELSSTAYLKGITPAEEYSPAVATPQQAEEAFAYDQTKISAFEARQNDVTQRAWQKFSDKNDGVKGWDYSFIMRPNKSVDFDSQPYETTTQKILSVEATDPEKYALHKKWRTFYLGERKKWYNSLSPEEKKMDIETGGNMTYEDDVKDSLETAKMVFGKSLLKNLSFGFSNDIHPVWGQDARVENPVADWGGTIIGSILSLVATGGVLTAAKVPQLMATIATKSPAAAKLLQITGAVSGKIDKVLPLGKLVTAENALSRTLFKMSSGGINEARAATELAAVGMATNDARMAKGLATAFSGTTFGVQSALTEMGRSLYEQDAVDEKTWRESLPLALRVPMAFLEGGIVGGSMHIANTPRFWGTRIVANAVATGGQTLLDYGLGKIKKEDFVKSFATNLAIGVMFGEASNIWAKRGMKSIDFKSAEDRALMQEVDAVLKGTEQNEAERRMNFLVAKDALALQEAAKGEKLLPEERSNILRLLRSVNNDTILVRKALDIPDLSVRVNGDTAEDVGKADFLFAKELVGTHGGTETEARELLAAGVRDDPNKYVEWETKKVVEATREEMRLQEEDAAMRKATGAPERSAEIQQIKDYAKVIEDEIRSDPLRKFSNYLSHDYRGLKESFQHKGVSAEEWAVELGYGDVGEMRTAYEGYQAKKEQLQGLRSQLAELEGAPRGGRKARKDMVQDWVDDLPAVTPESFFEKLKAQMPEYERFVKEARDGVIKEVPDSRPELLTELRKQFDKGKMDKFLYEKLRDDITTSDPAQFAGMDAKTFFSDFAPKHEELKDVFARRAGEAFSARQHGGLGDIFTALSRVLDEPGKVPFVAAYYLRKGAGWGEDTTARFLRLAGSEEHPRTAVSEVHRAFADLASTMGVRRAEPRYGAKSTARALARWQEATDRRVRRNAVTGINRSIDDPGIRQNIEEHGAALIDSALPLEQMGTFGVGLAGLQKEAKVLTDLVAEWNKGLLKTGGRIYLRHPEGTRFWLINNGKVSDSDFLQAITHISRIIRENYNESVDVGAQRYGVLVREIKPDQVVPDGQEPAWYVLDDFRGSNVVVGRDIATMNAVADQVGAVTAMARETGQVPSFGGSFIDTARPDVLSELRAISEMVTSKHPGTVEAAIGFIKGKLDNFPADTSPAGGATAKNETDIGFRSTPAEAEKRPITGNFAGDQEADIRADFQERGIDADNFNLAVPNEQVAQVNTEMFARAGNFLQKTESPKVVKALHNLWQDILDIVSTREQQPFFQKTEAGRSASQLVTQMAAQENRSAYETINRELRKVFERIRSKLSADDYRIVDNLFLGGKESEFRLLFDTVDGERHFRSGMIAKLTNEPIKAGGDFSVEDIMAEVKNYRSFTNYSMYKIREMTSDKLILSKIMVQKFGVDPNDLLKVYSDMSDNIYEALKKDKFKQSGDYLPEIDEMSFMKPRIEEHVRTEITTFLDSLGRFKEGKGLSELFFSYDEGKLSGEDLKKQLHAIVDSMNLVEGEQKPFPLHTNVTGGSKEIKPEVDLRRLKVFIDDFIDMDWANMSYVTFIALRDDVTHRQFAGQLADMLRGVQKRGSGADVVLDEMTGRSYGSMESFAKAGITIETSAWRNLHAVMSYSRSKTFKDLIAKKTKNDYVTGFLHAFTEWQDNLNKGMSQSEAIAPLIFYASSLHAGFYVPTETEIDFLDAKINSLRSSLSSKGDNREAKEAISIFTKKRNDLVLLREFWKSSEPDKDGITFWDKYGKRFGPDNKPILDPNLGGRATLDWRGTQLMRSTITGGDPTHFFLPVNKTAFADEKIGLLRGKPSEIGMAMNSVKARHVESHHIKSDERSVMVPDSEGKMNEKKFHMTPWDGLYFSSDMLRAMQQLVFADNAVDSVALLRAYDKVGSVAKALVLDNPLAMTGMNVAQLLNGVGWRGFAELKWAVRARLDMLNGLDSEGARFYHEVNAAGCEFGGHARGIGDQMITLAKFAGQDVSKERFFNAMVNRTGDPATAKTIVDSLQECFSTIGRTAATGYDVSRNLAWVGDETFRLASARAIFNRTMRGGGTRPMALLAAAKLTNKAFINSVDMPNFWKTMIGRVIMFPTYRIGNMMYEWSKVAYPVATIIRHFKGTGDPRILYSTEFKKQIVQEMMPAVRSILIKAAMKGTAIALGYNFNGIWELLTNYRAGKEGDDENGRYLKYLSLGGSMFDIEKLITRPAGQSLLYNLHAVPGLMMALLHNRNTINGDKIMTHQEDTAAMLLQVGLYGLFQYFPMLQEGTETLFNKDDLTFAENVFNFSGLGFVYKADNPQALYKKFEDANNKALSMGDRMRAQSDYLKGLRQISKKINGFEFKDQVTMMKERQEAQRHIPAGEWK